MTTTLLLAPWLKGLFTGGGLIIAIGAQNAFVLSQGIKGQHALAIATLCSLVDALLITAGLTGMGLLISQSPVVLELARWGGALFLILYGTRALKSALKPEALGEDRHGAMTLKKALLTAAALSLLNPHVYLDTVVLLGSIGGSYAMPERLSFGIGAITASILWFFTLGLGARRLGRFFRSRRAWRLLDGFVCLTMWGIAATLICSAAA